MNKIVRSYMSSLGKRGRGTPKNYTPEERAKRAERMKELNRKRRYLNAKGR